MSERLERAFRSLREIEDGDSPRADETLARVLGDLRATQRRRSRSTGTRMWLLAAAILAFSSMAAARSGSLGRVLRALSFADRHESRVPSLSSLRPAPSVLAPLASATFVSPPPADSESLAQPAAPPLEAASATTDSPELPHRQGRPWTTAPQRSFVRPEAAATDRAPAAAPPKIVVARSADDQTFEHANDLHFTGSDPGAALNSWDDYLRRFPGGRFIPEARYNRAIDLLKLGRNAEARKALQPFADRVYGSYRCDEARAILRSMP